MSKAIKVMTSAALLAGVVAPVAVTTVDAKTKNHVDKTPSVASDYSSTVRNNVGAITATNAISTLNLEHDGTNFTSGDSFRLTLPSGVKFDTAAYGRGGVTQPTNATVANITDSVLELTIGTTNQNMAVPLYVIVEGATGEMKVTVDPMDTTITGGSYTFGVVASGATATIIEEVKAIGKTGKIGTIRIDETSVGAVKDGGKVTLKLQPGVEWALTETVNNVRGTSNGNVKDLIKFGGGLAGSTITANSPDVDGRVLTFTVDTSTAINRSQRGSIYIETPDLKIDGAQKGDIEVSIEGQNITSQDLILAKYADWSGNVKVAEVKELVAGRDQADTDQKTAVITIEETVPGSFVQNRDIEVELPSWVKVRAIHDLKVLGGNLGASLNDLANLNGNAGNGNSNKFSVKIDQTNTAAKEGKIEFKVRLSIEANKTGDIEATVSGAGVEKQTAVIAKAISPVEVDKVEASQVKIGLQDQAVPDFVFGEVLKGTFAKDTRNPAEENDNIHIILPSGVTWSAVPTVEVVEGNLEIDTNSVVRQSGNHRILVIPVKSEGTKPSKVKVSGAKITVDRTVPEGKINALIGGGAVVKNYNNIATGGHFTTDIAAAFELATTVTPAPSDTMAPKDVTFTIGSTDYKVGENTSTMDVAPFVEGGRTYLPVRYVAEAIGVTPQNILYDNATGTVTILKGDRVAQTKLGTNILSVNGANIPMDAKAKTVNGRTVLPIRYVAQALGNTVEYDETTQTVTIK